jgi:hypothetical protein
MERRSADDLLCGALRAALDFYQTLELLLPLLILLTTLLFLLLVFLVFLLLLRKRKGGIILHEGGPTNLEQEDEIDGEGGLAGVEQRWLEGVEESVKVGYLRSKGTFVPNSDSGDGPRLNADASLAVARL